MNVKSHISLALRKSSTWSAAVVLGALWVTCLKAIVLFLTESNRRFLSLPALFALLFATTVYFFLCTGLWQIPFALVRLTLKKRNRAVRLGAAAASLGATAAPLFYLAASISTQGDWISKQSYAHMIAPIAAAVGGAFFAIVGFVKAAVFIEPKTPHAKGSRVLTVLFLLLSISFAAADGVLFPKQYQAFHDLLFGLCIFFSSLTVFNRASLPHYSISARSELVLVACALFIFAVSVGFVSAIKDKHLTELFLQSPTSVKTIRLIVPPTKRDLLSQTVQMLDMDGDDNVRSPSKSLEIGDDWNIVLAVIDAMRADVIPPVQKQDRPFAERGDTPFINRWLEKTYRFAHNYAPADKTGNSMPAVFHSDEDFDEKPAAPSLPFYMKRRGRIATAVVNNYFPSSPLLRAKMLLDDFDYVDVYDENRIRSETGKMRRSIKAMGSHPFFAWFHFYALHGPCFDESGSLEDKPIAYEKKYRRALRWMDGEFAKLIKGIDDSGLGEKTIVVLTADHGEALYDHGFRTHGTYVFDEEVRVPLAIYIPGKKGGVVTSVTGNVDLVPTFVDLFGGDRDRRHRGRSLVPLLADTKTAWDHPYFFTNDKKDLFGVAKGGHKLVYQPDLDILAHYDLERDPKETESVFDIQNPVDRSLVSSLVMRYPDLFSDEADGEILDTSLKEKLNAVNDHTDEEVIEFLLDRCVERKIGNLNETLKPLFERSHDDPRRLRIAHAGLSLDDEYWTDVVSTLLRQRFDAHREIPLIQTAASFGVPIFPVERVSEFFLRTVEERGVTQALSWMPLLDVYRTLQGSDFETAFVELFEKIAKSGSPDIGTARATVERTALLRKVSRQGRKRLTALLLPLLSQGDPLLKMETIRALTRVGDKNPAVSALCALLKERKEEENIFVSRAAVVGLAAIDKRRAASCAVENAADPLLARDIVPLLRETRYIKGIPYLNKIASRHDNRDVRLDARKAVEEIRQSAKPGRPKEK